MLMTSSMGSNILEIEAESPTSGQCFHSDDHNDYNVGGGERVTLLLWQVDTHTVGHSL